MKHEKKGQKPHMNYAISDSIASVLENGIDVNVNFTTESLIRLGFFAVILTLVIGATSYGVNYLKKI